MLRDLIHRLRMPVLRLVMPEKADRSRQAMAARKSTEASLMAQARSNHIIEPLPVSPSTFAVTASPDPQLPPRVFRILEEHGEVVVRATPKE